MYLFLFGCPFYLFDIVCDGYSGLFYRLGPRFPMGLDDTPFFAEIYGFGRFSSRWRASPYL